MGRQLRLRRVGSISVDQSSRPNGIRSEGYEATTVRDIAGAAQMSTGSVYREIGSKEELLVSIMRSFSEKVVAGWDAALTSTSTSVEKLDAVAWLQINVLERFHDEFKSSWRGCGSHPPIRPTWHGRFPACCSV